MSDGIHDFVDLDMMENIISSEGLFSDKCEQIIQMQLMLVLKMI